MKATVVTKKQLSACACYIALIVLLNVLFVKLPYLTMWGQRFTFADMTVGFIYIVRDFAQREIRHYILVAMLIGAALSYWLATRQIALASLSGFLVGELIDWGMFTFTKKPLSQRLLTSAIASAPVDSAVFLLVLGPLHLFEWSVMTFSKIAGVLLLWAYWRYRAKAKPMVTI